MKAFFFKCPGNGKSGQYPKRMLSIHAKPSAIMSAVALVIFKLIIINKNITKQSTHGAINFHTLLTLLGGFRGNFKSGEVGGRGRSQGKGGILAPI